MQSLRTGPRLLAKAALQAVAGPLPRSGYMEPIYRALLLRELDRHGIPDRFFPTNHAANHSLLYAVVRLVAELRPRAALDLGCGQTTLLLDSLRRCGLVGRVVSIEHAESWRVRIAAQVAHPILCAHLVANTKRAGNFYDPAILKPLGSFDLVVVDGPSDPSANGRVGLLDVAEALLAPDAAIVIDDTQRWREERMALHLAEMLRARGRPVSWQTLHAAKEQAVVLTGSLAEALWL